MIIERQCLLPLGRVIGVIAGQHDGGWGRRVAGEAMVHQRAGEALEVRAVHAMCQAGAGGGPGPGLLGGQRAPLKPQLAQGITAPTVGIIGISIAGGDWIDPLGEEVPQGRRDVGQMPLVTQGGGAAWREANGAVNAAPQEGAKVRGQGPPLEIGPHGMTSNGRQTPLVWRRIGHRPTFVGLYGLVFAQTLCYQRCGEALPFFMKHSG